MQFWMVVFLVVFATAWTTFAESRQRAHLRYLQGEIRGLGGEDRWHMRCTHCGRAMRDSASIRHSTRTPAGSGWVERTDGVFHLDRPDCAAAADKAQEAS